MNTIYITLKPSVVGTNTDEHSLNNLFVLPHLQILTTTTIDDVRSYQNEVLSILKQYKSDISLKSEDEKKANKIIQEIVELLTKLIMCIENGDKKQIARVAAKLHDYVETFNITGTFNSNIQSMKSIESDIKLKQLLIEQILEKIT